MGNFPITESLIVYGRYVRFGKGLLTRHELLPCGELVTHNSAKLFTDRFFAHIPGSHCVLIGLIPDFAHSFKMLKHISQHDCVIAPALGAGTFKHAYTFFHVGSILPVKKPGSRGEETMTCGAVSAVSLLGASFVDICVAYSGAP